MGYKTLYRKYRPKTFEQVVGQEHIVKTLQNALEKNKISHAYLFCGPKGTGKTSIAKIFANVLNCSHKTDVTKACDYCLQHVNDSLDIIEMDAASNNGVDEIRDLKEKIEQAPINSKYKIYIIDEVHMLTKSAFNALLKTLEEPPLHSIFIFATTDLQKVPLTIRSRVQTYNFNRMNDKNIMHHLANVLKQENITFEPEALRIIARLSSGGMRDALSIADQAAAFGNNEITSQSLYENFGILSTQETIKIFNLILSANAYELINNLNQLEQKGIDPQQFILSLITLNKEKILYLKTASDSLLDVYTKEELALLHANLEQCFMLADSFYEIFIKIQRSPFPFEIIQLGLLKISEEFIKTGNTVTIEISKVQENVVLNPINQVEPKVEVKPEIKIEFPQQQEDEIEINNDDILGDFNTQSPVEENPINTSDFIPSSQSHTTESILNLVSSSFKFDTTPHSMEEELLGANKQEEIIQSNDNNDLINAVDQKVHSFLNAPMQDAFLSDKLIKEEDEVSQMDLSFASAVEDMNKTKTMVNEMLNQTREFLLNNNETEADRKDVNSELVDQQAKTGEKENLISTREIDLNVIENIPQDTINDFAAANKQTSYVDFIRNRSIEEYVNDARWIQANKDLNFTATFKDNLANIDMIVQSRPEFKHYADLFKQVKIMFGSDRFIVLTSNNEAVLEELSKKGDAEELQNFIVYTFGEPYKYIYPIPHSKIMEIQNYLKQNQGNLPEIVEPEFLTELKYQDNDEWFINRANLFK
ncbi:DNA polymerase III subunit gamma/tau [Mycoplasma seminis]|uniref:DNA polymerase III subunit gamma/tau n=1 Tax=Mycoplasma seminis TaxID=512749 RepID=A0ABY9HAT7_9MOLU|nr:DNA polymerase III subunit gamma/tau [Mycoplasma seminis]WLP85715.1 DNA polymerase III subunit gamma/tau [Mycoplasma seminis]